MTTREQMIHGAQEMARKEGGGYRTLELEAAVDAGLVDGDVIPLGLAGGKHLKAVVTASHVEMVHGDVVTAQLPLADIDETMRARLIITKAAVAGRQIAQMG